MDTKPVLRYQLRTYLNIFSKVYGIVYFLFIVTLIFRYINPDGSGEASGTDLTTMIAVFISGLVLFKSAFRFFSSYGISRKRLFCGLTASLGITAAAVAAIDTINSAVFCHFIKFSTCYEQLSGFTTGSTTSGFVISNSPGTGHLVLFIPTVPLLLKNWLWCLLTDFALGMLGFLITVLYYRMGKTLKICVSIGVPATLLILLPYLDHNVLGGRISAALADFWKHWVNWGMNPGLDLVTRLVPIAIFGYCIWLLLRKADVQAG